MTELDLLWRIGGHIVAAVLLGIFISAILTVFKGRHSNKRTF